ncbi:CPBP family glutamic-type intramembrane protease [Morganella morganii]|uniref:CPBP family intramembrane glutamic endopeptidase n=1 Tax=Providencia TaxID=586 RepID=UPI00234A5413|nr:CPBP family intramembrane glutamic endopeptidase [Providencia sp. PROV132]EMB6211568.1 CPBP family intramembrane metalloprotease [Morganella morganii]EMB6212901.1 CPBP family intramembrane metalloprotease [Morganella morganii]
MYKKNETVVYLILAVLVLFISESSSDLIVNSRLDAYFYPNFYGFLINAIIGIALSLFALNFAKKNLTPIDLLGSINKYSFYSLLTMIALLSIILLVRWLDLDNIYLGGQIYAGGKPLFIQIVLLYLPVYIGIPLYQEIVFRGLLVNAFIKEGKKIVYIVPSIIFTVFIFRNEILNSYVPISYLFYNIPIVFLFSLILIYSRLKTGGLLTSIILSTMFYLVFYRVNFELII